MSADMNGLAGVRRKGVYMNTSDRNSLAGNARNARALRINEWAGRNGAAMQLLARYGDAMPESRNEALSLTDWNRGEIKCWSCTALLEEALHTPERMS